MKGTRCRGSKKEVWTRHKSWQWEPENKGQCVQKTKKKENQYQNSEEDGIYYQVEGVTWILELGHKKCIPQSQDCFVYRLQEQIVLTCQPHQTGIHSKILTLEILKWSDWDHHFLRLAALDPPTRPTPLSFNHFLLQYTWNRLIAR